MFRKKVFIVSRKDELGLRCREKFGKALEFITCRPEEALEISRNGIASGGVILDKDSCSPGEYSFLSHHFGDIRKVNVIPFLPDFRYELSNRRLLVPARESSEAEVAGSSSSMSEYRENIQRACRTDSVVLILGESGCGKDWTARYIHEHSSRKNHPFKNLNIAEINENLIESALFGRVKGAYTSAEQDEGGAFDEAGQGTLFIDEIGLLTLDGQSKFLGVMDKWAYSPVGSSKEIPVQSRLIFATDSDLSLMMAENKFKKQLYYRIALFVLKIPPLRERVEEIPSLAESFAAKNGKRLSQPAIDKLCCYKWPGNVRELEFCVNRGAIISDSDLITDRQIVFC